MSNITPDSWIERRPEDEPNHDLCFSCSECPCVCDKLAQPDCDTEGHCGCSERCCYCGAKYNEGTKTYE